MKNVLFVVLLLALGIGIGYLIFNPNPTPVKELNFAKPTPTPFIVTMQKSESEIAASFGIVTNGTFRTFTHSMYHNLTPEVFIESNNPNVVIVKKTGLTWDYFFKTLPFLLNKECLTTGTGQSFCTDEVHQLKFYINGAEVPDALEMPINHGDKLLVVYGDGEIENYLRQVPTVK